MYWFFLYDFDYTLNTLLLRVKFLSINIMYNTTYLSPNGKSCGNGGGAGLAGSEEAEGAGLCGDDGFDGTASGALRTCSGDSLPLLLLEHSRTVSSSWPPLSGELPAFMSSICVEKTVNKHTVR